MVVERWVEEASMVTVRKGSKNDKWNNDEREKMWWESGRRFMLPVEAT